MNWSIPTICILRIGVYNAYLIRSNNKVEQVKYRENVIRVMHDFKMNQDGMSRSRKLQLLLFCYMIPLYNMMFKVYNKNRTKFIRGNEKT